MINIGTHRKPFDEEEFHTLQHSLANAIENVLENPEFYRHVYFPVTRVGEGRNAATTKLTDTVYRTQQNLQIISQKAEYNIEWGGLQRRVDAHIILSVKHRRHIQFDHHMFQHLLDQQLLEENNLFEMRRVMSKKNPHQYLRWAEPRLYVSFRRIGGTTMRDTSSYINKANDPRPGIKERNPLTENDIGNLESMVPLVRDWVTVNDAFAENGQARPVDVARVMT